MAYDIRGLLVNVGLWLVIVLIGLIVGAIIGLLFWLRTKKKIYKRYRVIIWKRYSTVDGKNIPMIVDLSENGMVKRDQKLKKWVFHLKKNNVDLGEEELEDFDEDRELDIPSVPFADGGDVVFVEKLSKRKFALGDPFIIEGTVKIRVTAADQAEAIRAYDVNARTFGKKDHTLLAFAMYLVFAVLVLVLIVVVLNKLDALTEFGDKWLEGAQQLRQVGSSTVASGAPG